ncbi:MAG: TetR/AcrR family transcriptional regulator [Pseudomonadales bacterium]|nr:TetR/AcrR family transcriptional regulator [Pseudomonadales bacterium]MCP5182480.1 TetR/AcrR family transcriptional regulator [Pseudomonadales bacterium]
MQTYFRQQAIGAQKRVRTRCALIDSAIDVFSEKGFEEASISEIALLAGLANGTFYNHFRDKEELVAASAQAIALEIAKQLDARIADLDSGLSRIIVATYAFLRFALRHKSWGAVLVEQFQRLPASGAGVMEYLRGDIQRAVAQRRLEVVVDDFLLEQLAALMIASLRRQLADGFQQPQLLRTCEYVLRVLGLTPKQARRELAGVAAHPLLVEDVVAV